MFAVELAAPVSHMPYIVGLSSGSSFDGIDAVLCTIDLDNDGHPTPPKYVAGLTIDWPESLKGQVTGTGHSSVRKRLVDL